MRLEQYSDRAEGSLDDGCLLCFSHLRWDFVYQRPQHLLSRMARRAPVIFFEEPVHEDVVAPRLDVRPTSEGVRVAVPVLAHGLSHLEEVAAQRALVDTLVSTFPGTRRTLWYYTPMALAFSRHLQADLCVYDNMDELTAFRGASPRLIALEGELFRRADVVFTGGQSLFEAKKDRHHNVHAFPSSIDVEHFQSARGKLLADPVDQAAIPHPRLGFFGVVDERMNIDLIGQMADLRPDWQFVMIGPVVKIDPATLPQRPNIHWLGGKSYRELPDYLAGWDVGIMPFVINEATRFISPTKTPEFLAAGVPVVSTAITDVIRPYGDLGLVEIADTAEEIVAKAEGLLQREREPWLTRVDRYLATISWDITWRNMDQIMRAAMRRPVSADALSIVEDARV
jgi:glycosyltransferase involved in cell wall biosynthesis